MNRLNKVLVGLFLLLLLLPFLQSSIQLVDEEPLKGVFDQGNTEKIELDWKSWYSGDYQNKYDAYKKGKIGFRNNLIRIYNQYQYSLFRLANARGVISAKNNMVISEGYIKTYFGDDFIGSDSISRFLSKVKYVQDSLAKRDITLLLLVAPGKAACYPENIPDHYFDNTLKREDNYHTLIELAHLNQINLFDARAYVVGNKENFKHPVFPTYGIHWSGNTVVNVADTLINYINTEYEQALPTLSILPGVKTVKNYRFTDYDIGESMNLLWFVQKDSLYYPNLIFNKGPETENAVMLGVGDSFFQSFIGFYSIWDSIFSDESRFWFYNKNISWPSEFEGKGIDVSTANLELELARTNIVIVEMTDENIKMTGYNFIHDLYDLFTKGGISEAQKISALERFGNDTELLKMAESLYPLMGYTKEQMIQTLAVKKMDDLWKENFDYEAEVNKIVEKIRNDTSGWLEKVKAQAIQENISLEKCIRNNAIWLVNNKLEE